eukprot:gnl/Chilomastix_caulleri/91.p1 GENE.gnl/Chilomastix_caulleri/91~~gnl/Chilomastix_caulleri/91.p1  ORF type:complete len:308 (+),score=120.96 gnl/Chilomastix_caulleri/91:46-969(+)
MISILLVVALAACQFEAEWNKFKIAHGKRYSVLEDTERFAIFVDNMHYISLLNRLDKSATYGVTKFADLTSDEFAQRHLGFVPQAHEDYDAFVPTLSAPESLDWTTEADHVSPIQDQGSCGSCWAFSSIAGLETALVLAGGKLVKLSEQNLVDCDNTNNGCDGGNLTLVERYLKKTGVVESELYPYKAVQGKCNIDSSWKKYQAKSYGMVKTEDEMVNAVAEKGALPVAINATPVQFYTGGILDPRSCNPDALNHGVTIVGYGVEGDMPFWKIRNSWGTSWGEEGYFRMRRGNNTCGVATDATYIKA